VELITLPENIVTFINIVLITLAIVLALIGYFRGFVSQAYDLVIMGLGLFLGLLISPSLASNLSLVPSSVNFNDIPFVGSGLVFMIDRILWTIILVIIFLIIGFIFKGLLIKKVLGYKKKVLVDRIGGAVVALVPVFVLGFVIALTLSAPIFSNGSTLLNASVLSPLTSATSGIISDLIDNNPTLQLVDKIASGEALGEEDFAAIEATLKDMGFPEDVVDVAHKFFTKEEITEADLETLKTYAEDNDITPEQVKGWMKDLGFTDQQIEELMNQYQ
jgi:uncharacterized membrane protein required for colicin V production